MCFSLEEREARDESRKVLNVIKKKLVKTNEVLNGVRNEVSNGTKERLDEELKEVNKIELTLNR